MSIGDEIETHKHALKSSKALKDRRLSLPVSNKLQAVIDRFKLSYPNHQYTDTAVLKVFIEAGAKVWAAHQSQKQRAQEQE